MPWFWRTDERMPELVEAIRAIGKEATEISSVPISAGDPEPGITATRFGGEPYAETGDEWPTFGEPSRPLDFFCQINLKECLHPPEFDLGLIVIFFCWRSDEEGTWMDPGACVIRRYADPSPDNAVRLSRPAPVDESDYRVKPCAARLSTTFSYPRCEEEAARVSPEVRDLVMQIGKFDRLKEYKHEGERERVYGKALKRVDVPEEFSTRVGGYPGWLHDSPYDGDPPFVLQIGHEIAADICIGDAGVMRLHLEESGEFLVYIETF